LRGVEGLRVEEASPRPTADFTASVMVMMGFWRSEVAGSSDLELVGELEV
jgi:hypothetical protein